MHRFRRWAAAASAAALAVTLAAATPVAGAAEPDPYLSAAAAGGEGASVTLITGDVVELAPAGSGRYAAAVEPGPGRESVTFHTVEVDGGLQVLPSDAVPYLAAGVLDERLFDVPQLIAQGYDDESQPRLPLIVRYRDGGAPARGPAAAAQVTASLDSIGGAALAPEKADLGDVWQALTGPAAAPRATAGFGGGIAEIWLDGRVSVTLDRSAAQIGAPAAWQAGYDGAGVTVAVLDTGVDATHPDLAGKVAASENFTLDQSAADGFGHGTHVASTVAGAGSPYGGVAPGAELLAGKVLDDSGYGWDSWIIEGMEWAVGQGADVVNLSLGGAATDGTDPLSAAVDRLSKSGTLFVISAGNEGGDYTVGAPGAATSALTVGAVDRDEALAGFSSRGPRVGDNAPKPDLTAPGVGIVAARAAGTGLGAPVGDGHTALSGTSMAAPHVAGAAALLAQAYPDWDGAQLKDALVSTAAPNPQLPVFAQGAGRVDAARAAGQPVYATGVLDFGLHREPGSGGKPVTSQLVYTNTGDAAVTLALDVELTNVDRAAGAAGAVSLGTDQVTVPAGGTATVPVALDLTALRRGRHAGTVTATGPDGVLARSTLATTLAGQLHSVTFRAVTAGGEPAGADTLMLHGDEPRTDQYLWLAPGQTRTFQVEEGTYLLQALIPDHDPQFEQQTLITDPELEITGDTEIVLDAGAATPVRIETPKPSEQRVVFSYYVHRELGNGRTISHGTMHFSGTRQLNVTPTDPVAEGSYEFSSRWQLVAPMVTASVPGLSGPFDVNLLHRSPVWAGKRDFRLVRAGTGTPEELAAADVAGAAALVEASDGFWEDQQIAAAAEAGAAAVLIVRPADWSAWTVWRPTGDREPIPAFVVGHDDGQRIAEHVRRPDSSDRIQLDLAVTSPYLYDVMHVETGRVPEEIVYHVSPGNSARFDVSYQDTGGFGWMKEQRFGWRPWQTYAWNDTQRFTRAGVTRQEWVTAGDTIWQHHAHHEYTWDTMAPLLGSLVEAPRTYQPGRAGPVSFFAPVVRPAAATGIPGLVSTRTGNTLALRVPAFAGSTAGHYGLAMAYQDEVAARLLRDGDLVAELPHARQDVPVEAGPARYRLELTTRRESPEWLWAPRTETAWEFESGPGPSAERLPLLQIDYAVPADLTGRVPGRFPHQLGLTVRDPAGPLAWPRVRLEVSLDDGTSWQRLTLRRTGGGGWKASMPRGEGAVSLRVHAEHRGATITQTVLRAYGLG